MKKEKEKKGMRGNEIALRPSYWASVSGGLFWFEDFGKIVFTIKEEAEKELAERRKQ